MPLTKGYKRPNIILVIGSIICYIAPGFLGAASLGAGESDRTRKGKNLYWDRGYVCYIHLNAFIHTYIYIENVYIYRWRDREGAQGTRYSLNSDDVFLVDNAPVHHSTYI
jgi:hypothetical protein